MEYAYQFFTGGFGADRDDRDAGAALVDLYRRMGPGDVIAGWRAPDGRYRVMAEIAHDAGRRLWLWLPVFSELPESSGAAPSVSYKNVLQKGLSGFPGEDFKFVCPSDKKNIAIAYELYARYFAKYDFDGVFLDKIRHASFAGGPENGLGCFCERCVAAYAERGVDARAAARLFEYDPAAFIPARVNDCAYRFEDAAADDFFRAKAGVVSEAVTSVVKMFSAIGLEAALDVFAPATAYFVGQDLGALGKIASFIKPMFYRVTRAPAGLTYELDALRAAYGPRADVIKALNKIWGTDDLCSDGAARSMLASLKNCGGVFRPGFEINVVKNICESSPGYAASSVSIIEDAGFDKTVLCWDLFGDTAANLRALSNTKGRL